MCEPSQNRAYTHLDVIVQPPGVERPDVAKMLRNTVRSVPDAEMCADVLTSTSKLASLVPVRDVDADFVCDSHLEPVRLRKNASCIRRDPSTQNGTGNEIDGTDRYRRKRAPLLRRRCLQRRAVQVTRHERQMGLRHRRNDTSAQRAEEPIGVPRDA